VEIKIEAQTVVANEGGFEPHPESYTPRVFAAVMPPTDGLLYDKPKVYEILQNGQAIPWPCLPILEGFDYWVLYVNHLADVDMHRAPRRVVAEVEVQGKKFPLLTFPQDLADAISALPQADGDCPNPDVCGCGQSSESSTLTAFRTVPKDVTWIGTWIGEIDGKRYSGLGKPESGWAVTHMWRLRFDWVAPWCYIDFGDSDTPKSLRRTVIDWLRAL
jgi:hypothetical protein